MLVLEPSGYPAAWSGCVVLVLEPSGYPAAAAQAVWFRWCWSQPSEFGS